MNKDNPIIIHGPQGCGKSTHAAQFQTFFGLSNVLDGDWDGCAPLPFDTLVLTHLPPPYAGASSAQIMSYDMALELSEAA